MRIPSKQMLTFFLRKKLSIFYSTKIQNLLQIKIKNSKNPEKKQFLSLIKKSPKSLAFFDSIYILLVLWKKKKKSDFHI